MGFWDNLHISESELRQIVGAHIDDVRIRERTLLFDFTDNVATKNVPIPPGYTWIMWVASMMNNNRAGSFRLRVFPGEGKATAPHIDYPKAEAPPAAGTCGCVTQPALFPIVFREGSILHFADDDAVGIDILTIQFLYSELQKGTDY